MFLFAAVLALVSGSAIVTNRQVGNAAEQEMLADIVGQGASELGYLAGDYLIHRESQHLERWQTRFASFSRDLARLQADDPGQQDLVRSLQANAERLRAVFDSVASAVASAPPDPGAPIDPVLLRIAWSRMAVQSQGLILDAARLSEWWDSREQQLQRRNGTIVTVLIGVFGVYFLMNYWLIQRRMLTSLGRLQAGTAVIGSGDLDFNIEARDNDEIGDLSRAFNKMAADLRAATGQVLEERRRYQELFELAPDGYVVTDRKGTIQAANQAISELLGLGTGELVGASLEDFVAPADAPAFGEYLERLAAGEGEPPLRWEMRLQLNGYEPVIHTAVAATASHSVVGEVEGLRWLLRDVTREKQMQAALVHAGKLSIAGRLAASLAHEINNPLSAALGCAELATEAFETGEDPTQHLHVLCDALGRASRVVAQLREIHGEPRSEEKQPADLNALVEKVLLLTSKKAGSAGVEVSWERAENLPWPAVMVDSMQQVFLNLVLNAIEAMEGPGRLNVRFQQMRQPACVGVTFADDGPGIPPKVLEVLFEPFNTTKAQGSGLGLFISQNIVQQHGGTIEVETLAGQGTTFTVWLPL